MILLSEREGIKYWAVKVPMDSETHYVIRRNDGQYFLTYDIPGDVKHGLMWMECVNIELFDKKQFWLIGVYGDIPEEIAGQILCFDDCNPTTKDSLILKLRLEAKGIDLTKEKIAIIRTQD